MDWNEGERTGITFLDCIVTILQSQEIPKVLNNRPWGDFSQEAGWGMCVAFRRLQITLNKEEIFFSWKEFLLHVAN